MNNSIDTFSQLSPSRVQSSLNTSARASSVNRTRRVVLERAKLMQDRRKQTRSLWAPLIVCSVLLILSALAVWTGLYQYQTQEAAEAATATDASNNQFLVVLMWFVPVSVAVMATLWGRRTRVNADDEAR